MSTQPIKYAFKPASPGGYTTLCIILPLDNEEPTVETGTGSSALKRLTYAVQKEISFSARFVGVRTIRVPSGRMAQLHFEVSSSFPIPEQFQARMEVLRGLLKSDTEVLLSEARRFHSIGTRSMDLMVGKVRQSPITDDYNLVYLPVAPAVVEGVVELSPWRLDGIAPCEDGSFVRSTSHQAGGPTVTQLVGLLRETLSTFSGPLVPNRDMAIHDIVSSNLPTASFVELALRIDSMRGQGSTIADTVAAGMSNTGAHLNAMTSLLPTYTRRLLAMNFVDEGYTLDQLRSFYSHLPKAARKPLPPARKPFQTLDGRGV